jgi:tetratricopeptide (TPR) repeat protein
VNENKIQKRPANAIKEKGQYLLAFGVVGSMLLVAGFPVFVIFFFGIFAYFLFRIFASGSKNETREIFEFYLTANEILRDDGRSWFGFEIRDAVSRGEAIVNRMTGAPPLVYFALGALYHKAGEHQAAINSLTQVIESDNGNEAAYVYPTQELRNYVKVLRKIERDPGEAPLTSASIRALERARRLRGKAILEESRAAYRQAAARNTPRPELAENGKASSPLDAAIQVSSNGNSQSITDRMNEPEPAPQPAVHSETQTRREAPKREKKDPFADRKPITEVLHDIYDKNVQ